MRVLRCGRFGAAEIELNIPPDKFRQGRGVPVRRPELEARITARAQIDHEPRTTGTDLQTRDDLGVAAIQALGQTDARAEQLHHAAVVA